MDVPEVHPVYGLPSIDCGLRACRQFGGAGNLLDVLIIIYADRLVDIITEDMVSIDEEIEARYFIISRRVLLRCFSVLRYLHLTVLKPPVFAPEIDSLHSSG